MYMFIVTCMYVNDRCYLHWDVYVLVLGSHMQAGKMWVLQLFLVSGGKVLLDSALAYGTIIAFQGKSALADMTALIYKRWRISIQVCGLAFDFYNQQTMSN